MDLWEKSAVHMSNTGSYEGPFFLPPVSHLELVCENVSYDVRARKQTMMTCERRPTVRLLNDISVCRVWQIHFARLDCREISARCDERGNEGQWHENVSLVPVLFFVSVGDFGFMFLFFPCQLVSYMPQLDVMWPTLTVEEQISFQAQFRSPPNAPLQASNVDTILDKLGLRNCAQTQIGGQQQRQDEEISGGERKRTSVGSELVTNPAVLLLDEPLSGLDSSSALHVTQMLRALANEGRIVICTIHQPGEEIFHLFDTLLLLTKPMDGTGGNVAYFGSTKGAEPFFSDVCGLVPPPRMPLSSFYIENLTPQAIHSATGVVTKNQDRILMIVRRFNEVLRPKIHQQLSSSETKNLQASLGDEYFDAKVPPRMACCGKFA